MTNTPTPLPGHLEISLPPRWRRRTDPDHGVVIAARSPTLPPSGIRPEAVLRCAPVDDGLAEWRTEAVGDLASRLVDLEVEDDDLYDLEGQPVAYCRFGHRLGAADVVCEQWSWLVEGLGITLTCAVARTDYLDYCDLFEAVASTVAVVPRAA